MHVCLTQEQLHDLGNQIAQQVLGDRQGNEDDLRLYTEAEAADLLGWRSHRLRDARLRGEIQSRKVGKQYWYSKSDLRSIGQRHQE